MIENSPLAPGIGVSLPPDEGLSAPELVEVARAVESAGYSAVVTGEVAGPEAFALLGMIAAQTNRVALGTGVVAFGVRSAALLGMGFTTLASMAPGRVFAGVGLSSRTVVERWHGRTYGPPLATAREGVGAMRAVLTGGRLASADGADAPGFSLTMAQSDVPIVLAAMNPKMLELAGAVADGVYLAWAPVDEIAEKIARVRAGAAAAGRERDSVSILHSTFVYAGDAPDDARARMRRNVLGYATVPSHRTGFARSVRNLDAIDELWAAGDRAGALALVDDDAVDAMSAIGSADLVAERVHALKGAGVDLPVILPIGAHRGDLAGIGATVARVAEALGLRTEK